MTFDTAGGSQPEIREPEIRIRRKEPPACFGVPWPSRSSPAEDAPNPGRPKTAWWMRRASGRDWSCMAELRGFKPGPGAGAECLSRYLPL
jgi:hypothetical protein